MSGKLVGIGVGPGDPELLTIKALRRIQECDIVVLPNEEKKDCYSYQIVKQVYPEIDKKQIETLPFPMTKDRAVLEMAQNEATSRIVNWIEEDKTVVFLTIGDPCIYSTYHYIHRKIVEAGKEAEIINGVPSFCAVAGRLGISLADQNEEIHIIPASYDLEQTSQYAGTRIYMKAGKKLAELIHFLEKQQDDFSNKLDIYAVSNCGLENEKVMCGLEEISSEEGYLTIVIVKKGA